ncbi:MAG: hypothetical protein ACFFD4_29215, partial [Candidatus Odinarchaeota archaeon]
MDVIYFLSGILFLIFVILITVFSLKILLTYPDYSSLRLVWIILNINIWITSTVLILFDSFLLTFITEDAYKVIYQIGNVCLLLGIISFSYLMHNRLYRGGKVYFFSNLSILAYSMTLALVFVDLSLQQPLFFVMMKGSENGGRELELHWLTLLLISMALISTLIALTLAIQKSSSVTEKFFAEGKIIGLFVVVGIGFTATMGSIFLTGAFVNTLSLKLGLVIMTPAVMLLFTSLVYVSYTRPFLLLMGGFQPKPLLTQGYVGYLLAAFMDKGPQCLLISPEFKQRVKLDDESLTSFTLSALSLTGVVSETTENISLLPVSTDIAALAITFDTKNPEAEDLRLKEKTAILFAVLFPSIMTLAISNITNILPVVLEQV